MNKDTAKIIGLAVVASLVVSAGINLLADKNVPVVKEIREVVVGSAGNEYAETLVVQDGVSFGGGVLRGAGIPFARGTTTPCSLRAPTNASSTLISFFVNMTENTTTTVRNLTIATSTVPYATTTLVWDFVVTGNSKAQIALPMATTSGFSNRILAPGDYITAAFKGGNHTMGVGTTTELNGSCSALFLTEGR